MRFLQRKDLLEKLAKQTGRWLIERQGDRFYARLKRDHRPTQHLLIRHDFNSPSVLFETQLNVRFPLDRTPSGLFGRLLLRNLHLEFSAWSMDLGGSCEAVCIVSARVPTAGLTPALFNFVCGELLDEVHDFKQELREKYRGEAGQDHRGGQAMETGIRFIDTPPADLPAHYRQRQPRG